MEQTPQNESAVLNESRSLLARGDDAAASHVLEEYLKHCPDSKNAMRALAQIKMRQHHPDEAAHLFEMTLGRPSHAAETGKPAIDIEHVRHIEHGHRSLLSQGEEMEAADLLEGYVTGYLKSYPNSKNGLRALARIKMLQKRPEEAAHLFEQALGIVRNHFVAAKANPESLVREEVLSLAVEHAELNEPEVASIALTSLIDALSHGDSESANAGSLRD